MSDHRDGYRLVNKLFGVYETLPPRQQAIFARLMGSTTPPRARGFASEGDLAQEVREARAHFRGKLAEQKLRR